VEDFPAEAAALAAGARVGVGECKERRGMRPRHFVQKLDEARMLAAIEAAEQKSGGEIRVYISHRNPANALIAARARFFALGMHHSPHRKAVLIYLAPRTHQFAIWADAAAHEKCGDEVWQEITAQMTPLLKAGRFTEAIEHAIKEVAQALVGED